MTAVMKALNPFGTVSGALSQYKAHSLTHTHTLVNVRVK